MVSGDLSLPVKAGLVQIGLVSLRQASVAVEQHYQDPDLEAAADGDSPECGLEHIAQAVAFTPGRVWVLEARHAAVLDNVVDSVGTILGHGARLGRPDDDAGVLVHTGRDCGGYGDGSAFCTECRWDKAAEKAEDRRDLRHGGARGGKARQQLYKDTYHMQPRYASTYG